jgi:hypothetical protein
MSDYDYSLEEWDDDESFAVNMSDKEADSEVRAGTPLPKGEYLVVVDEVDLEESKSTKNRGKPMFNFKFKVLEGDFEGRNIYARAMLWDGALYTISQMMKAVGLDPKQKGEDGQVRIPPARWWQGKQMVAVVVLKPKFEKNPETEAYDVPVYEDAAQKVRSMQNDTAGFKSGTEFKGSPKADTGKAGQPVAAKAGTGATNLLP